MTGTLLKRLEQHICWSSQKHVLPPRGALRKSEFLSYYYAKRQGSFPQFMCHLLYTVHSHVACAQNIHKLV